MNVNYMTAVRLMFLIVKINCNEASKEKGKIKCRIDSLIFFFFFLFSVFICIILYFYVHICF